MKGNKQTKNQQNKIEITYMEIGEQKKLNRRMEN